ncbi:MAG TPA: class I SAM-dependent methyltransferase [Candidatus Anaerostipes excrementavium]|uniref:Class I SAM-dependent methyltransferase n=1 Tax=Candidatus Anaerostipes excrementavium TaxID=2838463 RepID=A0A9D2BA80_9FIRM|nr:class I SAM-dependent methyltransferase [uncultured Anaerostipes sp.]HIX69010.1 class I SAM-dependent methyltransferase [Candidatus Anaerostipes excrementavium]
MELSKRLQTIASYVTEGFRAADVGTDHGYIPIYLVQHKRCPHAFAMDINEGPLQRAKQHIAEMNLESRIDCILSDGLDGLPQKDVDSVILAGMGGDLIVQILERGKDKLSGVKELILSPQSHPERVRLWLHQNGFRILQEKMLIEDGKYYVICRAVHGTESYEKACFYDFGRFLIMEQDPTLLEYLNLEYQKYEKINQSLVDLSKEHIQKRKTEVEQRLGAIKEALGYYEM